MADVPTTSYSDRLSEKLVVRRHPDKGGYGVFAGEAIAAGEVVVVWGGEIVTQQELDQLPEDVRVHSLQVEENHFLRPVNGRPTEPGDLINHSCDPNVGLSGQIVLVAMRPIKPGEEICFDYAMSDGSPYDEFNCQCGAANCRRRVTGKDWQRPELQARYDGYFAPYLQRRIARLRQEKQRRVKAQGRLSGKSSSSQPGSRQTPS